MYKSLNRPPYPYSFRDTKKHFSPCVNDKNYVLYYIFLKQEKLPPPCIWLISERNNTHISLNDYVISAVKDWRTGNFYLIRRTRESNYRISLKMYSDNFSVTLLKTKGQISVLCDHFCF